MNRKFVDWNRRVSWFFAVGYVFVHYAYPLRHGEGDLMSMELVPRTFFMVSFVWMSVHAGMAWKVYGKPKLFPGSLREVLVLDSWLVLLITTPIFSIPALGASRLLMALAWPPLAGHLALNAWFLCTRAGVPLLRSVAAKVLVVILWLGVVLGAAVQSFPH
jgi:hypothetical protein